MTWRPDNVFPLWRCIGLGVIAGWSAVAKPESTVSIRWRLEESPAAVEVAGLSSSDAERFGKRTATDGSWVEILAVFAEQNGGTAGIASPATSATPMPPMAGSWEWGEGRLRFFPQFPPARSVRYRAELRQPGAPLLTSYFEFPADQNRPSTEVVQVFPSADVLPENQLKFYVQFSAPMSRGGVYEHIHIRDAAGRIVDLAFLELGEELWDPAMTRLTLLIDPGRIKRGVKPLEEIGPVFEVGRRFSLSVGAECHDAAGRPLRVGYEKRFTVAPADRSPPDPQRWAVSTPAAGTREALVLSFDEPMDQALALRLISVDGVEGDAVLGAAERQWRLIPDQPWQRGAHRIRVATTIEDLAGNNIGKAFDVDVFERVQRRVASGSITIPFEVR